jgi:hypothetical protein
MGPVQGTQRQVRVIVVRAAVLGCGWWAARGLAVVSCDPTRRTARGSSTSKRRRCSPH